MRVVRFVTVFVVVGALLVPQGAAQDEVDGNYQGNGDVGGFANIMPPGQDGVLNGAEMLAAQGGMLPPHFNDQTPLYEELVYAAGLPVPGAAGEEFLGVTDGDLARFYKDASFGAAGDVVLEDVSMCGDDVVAFRDTQWGVPHVYADTRESAQCANGYLTAADRLFLMDILRHLGRARLSEFLGASPANIRMDEEQLLVAPYTDEDFEQQRAAICESSNPEFQQVCADGAAYIEGVNHYVDAARSDPRLLPGEYPALQQAPEDFVLTDIIATASLVGGIFGKGGGGEAANSAFYAGLVDRHGAGEARALFDDAKAANDPDAAHTIEAPYPYNNHTDIDPSTTALIEPGSLVGTFEGGDGGGSGLPNGVADGPFGPIDLRGSLGMSNAILASAAVTDADVPIAVFGPQTGYFTPQLLVEMDIHAPGLDARGVAFALTNIYVQLGRGRDYAWSATSASGDLVDEWALELCDPAGGEATIDSTGYVWDGTCAEIPVLTHTQVAKPTAAGLPQPGADAIVVTREIGQIPELGDAPVVARALTTDGQPVAIAEQRSTFSNELSSALGFLRINDPTYMAGGSDAFLTAMDGIDYTFNWFYADQTDIAYKHSCLCPIRDPDTDPDLLTWGGRGHQWTGQFLQPHQQPQAVNPPAGFLANWNNKQAPGFRAPDDSHKHHSADRRAHLAVRMAAAIASGVPLTRSRMVDIAQDAGTVDLNGQEIFPLALQIMAAAPPSGEDAAQLDAMFTRLSEWVATGGHRRDVDRDGTYDHAVAIAVGDAWVRPLLDAVIGDELGGLGWPEGIEDHPRQGVGSAYNSGQVRFLPEDFRQVLGLPVAQPRSRTYCADGTVAGCAAALWASLAQAADVLATPPPDEPSCAFPEAYHFGSEAVDDWVYPSVCDQIVQSAAGVVAAPPMQWVNRPTFQQVVEAGTLSGRIAGLDRIRTAAALSRHAWPDGAETVVIASAGTFADAVAGAPLAAANDAPLLLTGAVLSPATAREITRLGATNAIVLGGLRAVPENVVASLQERGLEVTRVGGTNRFETAVEIAAALGVTDRFVLADGGNFPDALAAGPFAAADGRAVLLTPSHGLPAEVAELLSASSDVIVAGGAAAVPEAVVSAVIDLGAQVQRIAGPTRYATAAAFTLRTVDLGADPGLAYVVTGEDFPDALTAGAVAARTGGSLVLLQPDDLAHAPAGRDFLVEHAERVWFVGGHGALPSALRAALERLV